MAKKNERGIEGVDEARGHLHLCQEEEAAVGWTRRQDGQVLLPEKSPTTPGIGEEAEGTPEESVDRRHPARHRTAPAVAERGRGPGPMEAHCCRGQESTPDFSAKELS